MLSFDIYYDLEFVYESYVHFLRSTVSYLTKFAIYSCLWILVYLLICSLLYWLYARRTSTKKKGGIVAKRALVVVAHPDDECMFFGPTIYRLREQAVDVYLLCLSDGNYEKKGWIRRQELWRACAALGVAAERVCLVSDSRLPDHPRSRWPAPTAAHLILHHLEAYGIDTLITFDKGGVSGHLNHTSLFYAVAYLFIENKVPKNCSVYTLDTVNILRKYWGYLDLPLSYIFSSKRYFLTWSESRRVVRAMKQHESQMVWFRWLYVWLSRYVRVNSLRQLSLVDIELELTVDD